MVMISDGGLPHFEAGDVLKTGTIVGESIAHPIVGSLCGSEGVVGRVLPGGGP
jgi:hypothetical protein